MTRLVSIYEWTLKTKYLYSFAFLFKFHFAVIKEQSFPNLKNNRIKKVTIHRRYYRKKTHSTSENGTICFTKKRICTMQSISSNIIIQLTQDQKRLYFISIYTKTLFPQLIFIQPKWIDFVRKFKQFEIIFSIWLQKKSNYHEIVYVILVWFWLKSTKVFSSPFMEIIHIKTSKFIKLFHSQKANNFINLECWLQMCDSIYFGCIYQTWTIRQCFCWNEKKAHRI